MSNLPLTRRPGVRLAFRYVLALILVVIFVFPIYWLFIISFKTPDEIFAFPPVWYPSSIQFSNYKVLFKDGDAWSVWNSLVLASVSTFFAMILGTIAAYSLVRFKTGGENLAVWIISQRMMPPVAIVFPLFLLYVYFGWVDSYHGLIILYTAFSLPYVIWMMRGTSKTFRSNRGIGPRRWLHALGSAVEGGAAHGALRPLRHRGLHLRLRLERLSLRTGADAYRGDDLHGAGDALLRRSVELLGEDRRHVGAWHHPRLLHRGGDAALSGARHLHGRSQGLVMSDLKITGLHKYYGSFHAVKGVDLDVPSGEFTVLVGPSGCGKSTLLRTIAGLEEASQGKIEIGGKDVTWARPRDRDIAMVFQNYALYPYLNVKENIAFGLRARKFADAEVEKRVKRAAEMLGIAHLLGRFPRELSGGQRQRVAIGRAIVRDAILYLFDEPLSNLDAQLRDDMRVEIKRLHQELGRTMVYVTHDQIEAMTLADRIVLLRDGVIEQQGAPLDLFERPQTRFVAGFLGSPKMNFVPATLTEAGVTLGDGTLLPLAARKSAKAGQSVLLGIRPQYIAMAGASLAPGHVRVPVTIELVQPTGSRVQATMPLGGTSIIAELAAHDVSRPGERTEIDIDMTRAVIIDPQTEKVI